MKENGLWRDFWEYLICWRDYLGKKIWWLVFGLEKRKSKFAFVLYQQRGKYAKPFVHSGMILLLVLGVTVGPKLIAETSPVMVEDWWGGAAGPVPVLAAGNSTFTFVSEKPRAEVLEYTVREGDTISTAAKRFGVSVETVMWANGIASKSKTIKVGETLRILPVTGVFHKVKRGETVYSIAKLYDVSPQAVVDWPYNTFANDETFALAVGQELMIPDGVKPEEKPVAPRYVASQVPAAGSVTGTGQFAWPTSGRITQWFRVWHQGVDIANQSLPNILAADDGVVTVAGWPSPWAYGNRVMIDHGNGYVTLYAHMSQIFVSAGQRVSKGQAIGRMGSTGRSTGPHLHFEIRLGGRLLDPLGFLQ